MFGFRALSMLILKIYIKIETCNFIKMIIRIQKDGSKSLKTTSLNKYTSYT